jgi:hypothetical protein
MPMLLVHEMIVMDPDVSRIAQGLRILYGQREVMPLLGLFFALEGFHHSRMLSMVYQLNLLKS